MPSITSQRVGKYTYLYESESFWDPVKKRPDNNKVRIGKIDLLTGEPVYDRGYLDKLASRGEPVEGLRPWDKGGPAGGPGGGAAETAAALAALDSVRDFGVVYFLRELSEKIGLLGILRETMPDSWRQLFCLACFLVAADKPMMYCEDWAAANAGLDAGSMSSQRISDLLASFGCRERNGFYKAWYEYILEREYIALDVTSVSSYSERMGSVEWGHNRDNENLPQVNICMLLGEESRLPVYQTLYSGSLSDVTTLRATMSEFSALTGATELMVVMDKGFFSAKNVNMILGECKEGRNYRFLMSVPFTSKFAKGQVESERKDIDSLSNVVLTNGAPIRGVHKLRSWGSGAKLNTHVFFNPEKAARDRNELYGYVTSLARKAAADPWNKKLSDEYGKYLVVRRSQTAENGVTVSIREDVVAGELETVGWFVLLSNHIDNAQAAHDIYRAKDVVEKGFLRYKNNLGLGRLRVHSDDRMQNKVFVAFIALIIASAIHQAMKREGLFKGMTFDKLLLTLAKLKTATVNGKAILRPATKEQGEIFKAFGIRHPDYDTLMPKERKKRGRKPKAVASAQ